MTTLHAAGFILLLGLVSSGFHVVCRLVDEWRCRRMQAGYLRQWNNDSIAEGECEARRALDVIQGGRSS